MRAPLAIVAHSVQSGDHDIPLEVVVSDDFDALPSVLMMVVTVALGH